jgi:hypothetical protein
VHSQLVLNREREVFDYRITQQLACQFLQEFSSLALKFAIQIDDELFALSNVTHPTEPKSTERTLNGTTLWVKNFGFKCNVYYNAGHWLS